MRKLTDLLAGALVELFCCAAHLTPPSVGLLIGRILGLAACLADPHHRNIARANLRFAFQDIKDDREINRLVRLNFIQWGMLAYELSRSRLYNSSTADRWNRYMAVSGVKHLIAAKNKSASVILLSAHFGNWEYCHQYYSRNINPLSFIVRRIDNPHVEQLRIASNQAHGVSILYKDKGGLKTAIQYLKKGQDLVILADQKANVKEGIPCRFFGHQTMTLPIVAALAKKYKYPIVPMFVVREKNNVSHRIVFLPELLYSDVDTIGQIAQRQNDIIEAMIRRYPDHWLWMHRKWKTEHPEIYNAAN